MTYYVTEKDAVEFKVKISSSTDPSKWRATLTNALDFRFDITGDAVREGLADGTTEYTVRVIATKPAGANLRTTRLLFTSEYLAVSYTHLDVYKRQLYRVVHVLSCYVVWARRSI